MDSMNLKDFRPDNPDFDPEDEMKDGHDSEIPASLYHEEVTTLKIDKLSNRITIISVIIPCLIIAILVFAYLDIKERVVDVDLTKQSQFERISQQLEEKLNALDVKIAKNKYDLDNNLPELSRKNVALEGQITKLINSKADASATKAQFSKIEKRVTNNANQGKTTVQTIERINKQTVTSINENQIKFDKTANQIKEEITLFKEEFDARLLELSNYDQQIGELRKDLSLLDKKYKDLGQESASKIELDEKINLLRTDVNKHIAIFDKEVSKLNQKLSSNISKFEKDLKGIDKPSPKNVKPKPQINIDSSGSVNIEEESLTQ